MGLFSACATNTNPAKPGIVPPAEAKSLIDSGALIVDVRSKEEFNEGHLSEALLIPHTEVESRLAEFGSDKSRTIVLYCRSGGRAGKVKDALKAHGYNNVVNAGGYEALSGAGIK